MVGGIIITLHNLSITPRSIIIFLSPTHDEEIDVDKEVEDEVEEDLEEAEVQKCATTANI
jgi:hypothetical protein